MAGVVVVAGVGIGVGGGVVVVVALSSTFLLPPALTMTVGFECGF